MANTIFNRLNFNYDTTKFGSGFYINQNAANSINAFPLDISSWQKEEIANGNVSLSRFFQNPVKNVCDRLTSNTSLIINFCVNDPANTFSSNVSAAMNLSNTANNLLIQILDFKSHTDNMSRLSVSTSNTDGIVDIANIPNYEMAMSQGQELVRLLYQTESVQNTSPILGCFTSLFIDTELTSNNSVIANDYITLSNSFNGSTSNVSNSTLISIENHLEAVNTLMYQRRTSDWNFFKKQKEILDDYYFVSKFNSLGNTENYLITNYIGTNFLKNSLANT
jgi:hypothetical protein